MIATGYRHPHILTDCALRLVAIRFGWLADHVAERLHDEAASLAGDRTMAVRFGTADSALSISFEQDSSRLIASSSPKIATASKTGDGFIEANSAFQVRAFIFVCCPFLMKSVGRYITLHEIS